MPWKEYFLHDNTMKENSFGQSNKRARITEKVLLHNKLVIPLYKMADYLLYLSSSSGLGHKAAIIHRHSTLSCVWACVLSHLF